MRNRSAIVAISRFAAIGAGPRQGGMPYRDGGRDPPGMRRRLLLLELDPRSPTPVPALRLTPLVLLPLPDGRAAVPLSTESAEEVLATLLADGLPIRASRVIET
jgi:hypothetical protein